VLELYRGRFGSISTLLAEAMRPFRPNVHLLGNVLAFTPAHLCA
jgi:hypothetical protein